MSWLLIAFVVLLLLGVAGRITLMFTAPRGGFPTAMAVSASQPMVKTVPVDYQTVGELKANRVITLKSELNGQVDQVLFEEGSAVREGQLLFIIEPQKVASQLAQSQGQLLALKGQSSTAQAQVQQAKAALTAQESRTQLAQSEYGRFQQLHREGFISDLELQQKESTFLQAEADLQAAQQTLRAAQAQVSSAQASYDAGRSAVRFQQANLTDTQVRAPFSGVISRRLVDPGQFVRIEEPLGTLVDASRLDVVFHVPQRLAGQLHTGQRVRVALEGQAEPALGAVRVINPLLDADSRTREVEARLEVPGALVGALSGELVQVALELDTHPNAVVIAESAVRPQATGPVAFVVAKNEAGETVAKEVKLTLGERLPGEVEVLAGLSPSDTVITDGLQRLEDQKPVVIKGAETDQAAAVETAKAEAVEG